MSTSTVLITFSPRSCFKQSRRSTANVCGPTETYKMTGRLIEWLLRTKPDIPLKPSVSHLHQYTVGCSRFKERWEVSFVCLLWQWMNEFASSCRPVLINLERGITVVYHGRRIFFPACRELRPGSLFKASVRSVYRSSCFAFYQRFCLSNLFLPRFIQLHFPHILFKHKARLTKKKVIQTFTCDLITRVSLWQDSLWLKGMWA